MNTQDAILALIQDFFKKNSFEFSINKKIQNIEQNFIKKSLSQDDFDYILEEILPQYMNFDKNGAPDEDTLIIEDHINWMLNNINKILLIEENKN